MNALHHIKTVVILKEVKKFFTPEDIEELKTLEDETSRREFAVRLYEKHIIEPDKQRQIDEKEEAARELAKHDSEIRKEEAEKFAKKEEALKIAAGKVIEAKEAAAKKAAEKAIAEKEAAMKEEMARKEIEKKEADLKKKEEELLRKEELAKQKEAALLKEEIRKEEAAKLRAEAAAAAKARADEVEQAPLEERDLPPIEGTVEPIQSDDLNSNISFTVDIRGIAGYNGSFTITCEKLLLLGFRNPHASFRFKTPQRAMQFINIILNIKVIPGINAIPEATRTAFAAKVSRDNQIK
ncbi:MAG: hypothetical protein ACRC5M_04835 [Anaeroplasmataceae bacterium]